FLNLDTLASAGQPQAEPDAPNEAADGDSETDAADVIDPDAAPTTQPSAGPDSDSENDPDIDPPTAAQPEGDAADPTANNPTPEPDPAAATAPRSGVTLDGITTDPPRLTEDGELPPEVLAQLAKLDPEERAQREAEIRAEADAAANARMQEQLEGLLDQLAQRIKRVSFASIGVVGVAVLIWGTISLLVTVERSFNQITGAVRGRPWSQRVPIYWAVVTLGPLLLATGMVMLNRTLTPEAMPAWLGGLVGLIRPLSSLATSWLLAVVMYTLVPTTRVRLRPAMAGALVAAVAWEASKALFGTYVKTVGTSAVYGALGLIPLGMLWLYLTWLIVIFGLIVTHAVQTLPAERLGEEADREDAVLGYDRGWLLRAAAAAAHAFQQGGALEPETWAEHTDAPDALAARVLEDLASAGVLRRIELDGQAEGYVPARPPDAIEVASILELAGEKLGDRAGPAAEALAEADRAAHEALHGMTLADLAADAPPDPASSDASPPKAST
ncbi:MAG: YhjD/YihY/BrkB family envelope integrity protein, partial [Planctomycetota bacterium]